MGYHFYFVKNVLILLNNQPLHLKSHQAYTLLNNRLHSLKEFLFYLYTSLLLLFFDLIAAAVRDLLLALMAAILALLDALLLFYLG